MSDLIDRKELGAAIDNWLAIDRYYHPYSKQKTIPVSELVDIIKLLQSAQPERKKGEWINRSLNICYPDWERYTCSVCGKHSYSYDYCPNCGADMRGEQDG